jgi:hypothetical protein
MNDQPRVSDVQFCMLFVILGPERLDLNRYVDEHGPSPAANRPDGTEPTPIGPFTQPIVRFDLDRMDDNDNRLFGVTAQISWVPKPSYQLTIRTPPYLVRN